MGTTTDQDEVKGGVSDEKYVEAGGAMCPFCRSDMLYADSAPEVDGGECRQVVRCLACGEEWTDLYRLQGYLSATGAFYDDAEAHTDDSAEMFLAGEEN